MLEMAADAPAASRAFLRIGGLTVARQQLAIATAMQCERIVCIAPALNSDLVELQHLAEARGIQFHVIPGARPLLGLITATDEVIAFADGLFASTAEAVDLLSDGQSVLVQPVEAGIAAGFERIDLNHAAAGAMRVPGRLVERIADLPADCDAISALQRIALQAGVRQRAIPPAGQDGLFWTLVRSDGEAHTIEPQWIRQRTRDTNPLGPARGLALLAVRSLGPTLLHAGSGARALVVAAAVVALLALGAGWFGLVSLGLGLVALGWLLRESAALLARIESDSAATNRGFDSLGLYGWGLDLVIVLLLGWGTPLDAWQPFHDRLFPPFMLVAAVRVVAQIHQGRWGSWLNDRSLLAVALMGAVMAGLGSGAAHVGAIIAIVAALFLSSGKMRLTRP